MPDPFDHQPQSALDSLVQWIPGFRGYWNRERRREADQLLRHWLAERLDAAKRQLDQRARPLADLGQIDLLPQMDRLRGRLDKMVAKVRGATQGYSGFFDLAQVDQDRLEEVYQHDVAAIDQIDALVALLESLPSEPRALADALPELAAKIAEAEKQWNRRDEILRGMTEV